MNQMQELYEKVAEDRVLQSKFADIMKDAEKLKPEDTEEKLIAFAKEAGYTISIEEMQAYFKKLSDTNEGELSESELDMVAGGKGKNFWTNTVKGMGIGCAIGSAGAFMTNSNCGKVLNMDPLL